MNLSGADFSDADLRNVDLCDSDLVCADLRGAALHGANIDGTDFFFAQRDAHDHPIEGWRVVCGLMVLDCHRRNGDPDHDSLLAAKPHELAKIYREGGPLASEAISLLVSNRTIQKIITKTAYDAARLSAFGTDAKQLALDYEQEVMLRLVQKLKLETTDLAEGDFLGLVKTIAANAIRNAAKPRRRFSEFHVLSDIDTEASFDEGLGGDLTTGQRGSIREATDRFGAEEQEKLAANLVAKALPLLAEKNREYAEVLSLDLLGLSDQEIADMTNVPISTVRTRRFRGSTMLNEIVQRQAAQKTAAALDRVQPRRRTAYAARGSRTL
jgi:DNA-directed RNA polymerase specialized sigma24 family protein